jgi:predicted XRE-type DNA-binding protein
MNNGKPPKKAPIECEDSCGNVFADLGLENPEALLATAKLIGRLRDAMEDRNLTESTAARQLGIARKDLAGLLRGNFDLYPDAEIASFTRKLRRVIPLPNKPGNRPARKHGAVSS